MDVILLERIEHLGTIGDVVAVRPGYARNYLLPQHKAVRATAENKARFDEQRAHLEARNAERRAEAETLAKDHPDLTVTLIRQAGEAGQLYGSVTARDIAVAVEETGLAVSRNAVRLQAPIKTLGLHTVSIALHPEVLLNVVVNVARSTDEAATQARTGLAAPAIGAEEDEDEEEIELEIDEITEVDEDAGADTAADA